MKSRYLKILATIALSLSVQACGDGSNQDGPHPQEKPEIIQITKSLKEVPSKFYVDPNTLPPVADLRLRLDQFRASWGRYDIRKSEKRDQEILLNAQIVTTVSTSKGIDTPFDFLVSQKNEPIYAPIPMSDNILTLMDGKFYKLQYNGHDLDHPELKENAINRDDFGYRIYSRNGVVYVKFDGVSWSPQDGYLYSRKAIIINGQEFPANEGGTYQTRENDLLFIKFNGLHFQMKILSNGRVLLPKRGRVFLSVSKAAKDQSIAFRNTLNSTATFNYTKYSQSNEIPEQERLKSGFYYYSLLGYFDEEFIPKAPNDRKELIFVSPESDDVLRKMMEYLEKEVSLFHLDEVQKAFRIALMMNSLIDYDDIAIYSGHGFYKYGNKNFMIGEFLNGGKGVCRHIAILFKALADHLQLDCSLVQSYTGRGDGHTWNYCNLRGEHYLVDSTQSRFIPLQGVNRHDPAFRPVDHYYGIGRVLAP